MSYYDQVQRSGRRHPRARPGGAARSRSCSARASAISRTRSADAVTMPYGELPHWPASRVIGHDGQAGRRHGRAARPIAALAGPLSSLRRARSPDGRRSRSARSGVLGVKTLILTNAAGGVNTGFAQGALMVIDDHINLTGHNPLVGENDERFGARFPDMTEVYSARLRGVADRAGQAIELTAAARRLRRPAGAQLRNARGDPLPADDRRRRGRHVDGARGDRRPGT